MTKIFEDKDYDKAEEIMLDFVGGGTWEESLQCDFSSAEVQELIAKGIKAERAEAQKPNASENTLPIQNVSGCFSFAKYVNGWYEYADNTESGDVYNNVVTGRLMTEQQIFNEWLKVNNR